MLKNKSTVGISNIKSFSWDNIINCGTYNRCIFVSLKEEIPNKSASEILESLPLKIFSSMLWMLLRKIDLSSEKKKCNEENNEQ